MEKDFWNLLAERIFENGFTEQRINDAVNKILDNFQYKELNISDIIRFDRRKKLYTASEVYKISGQFPSPLFKPFEFNEKRFWTKIADEY